MKIHARIQKWGNGLALRVAGAMRDIPHFHEGTEVDVEITENGFTVIKSIPKKSIIFPFSEAQLLKGMTSEKAPAHLLAQPLPGAINCSNSSQS